MTHPAQYFNPKTPKELLISLINDRKVVKTESVTTAGGSQTTTYLDIPRVLEDERGLNLAAEVLRDHLIEHGLMAQKDGMEWPDMVVGPMTGSIPLVVGLAMNSGYALQWAVIRDEIKDHGLGRAFVGAEPGPDDKVILVDDVASSGVSLVNAYEAVVDTGADVIAIAPLVDRGDRAEKHIRANGRVFRKMYPQLEAVPYLPVLTYKNLGMEAL
jgi:orotate phosphoribosyltransferase